MYTVEKITGNYTIVDSKYIDSVTKESKLINDIGSEVAVAFTFEKCDDATDIFFKRGYTFTYHKIGNKDVVSRYMKKFNDKTKHVNPEWAMHCIMSSEWPIEELQKMMDCSGYAPSFCREYIKNILHSTK